MSACRADASPMADELQFDMEFNPRIGAAEAVAPHLLRIVAPNPGPMTFRGTNSYVIGRDTVAVVDPGPDDADHLAALLRAIEGRPVAAILVTHCHLDHTGLARRLGQETGAQIWAQGPHRAARGLTDGEFNALDAAVDRTLPIDRLLADGDMFDLGGESFEAVGTPGHVANHLGFALPDRGIFLSGDHVMGWATTLVAPPDGSMAQYMDSLDRLMARSESLYLPGHGGPIAEPRPLLRGLRAHRRMRERAIVERLSQGDETIAAIVAAIYRQTDSRLMGAAALNVLAHLEFLAERGLATTHAGTGLDARWRLTRP